MMQPAPDAPAQDGEGEVPSANGRKATSPTQREARAAATAPDATGKGMTNTSSVFRRSAMLTRNARFVRTALGLHPERAREHELALLDTLLDETRYVGEIGLDYVTDDVDDREAQHRVFVTFLDRCASRGNKVLTVHSRRAADDVVAMVGRSFPGAVILHWFSGSLRALKSAVAQGCYFSVNTAMVVSTSGMRLIREMPQERILTETDGPFIMVSGRPARPADIETVVSGLASLWSLDPDEASATILGNFQRALIDREAAERVAPLRGVRTGSKRCTVRLVIMHVGREGAEYGESDPVVCVITVIHVALLVASGNGPRVTPLSLHWVYNQ